MGLSALAFKKQNPEQAFDPAVRQDMAELSELERFLSKPQSIGLNNVKESLRSTVTHMMALMGLDTGYSYTQILNPTGAAYDQNHGAVVKKKKKNQQFWDDLLKLEELLAKNFMAMQTHVREILTKSKQEVEQQIYAVERLIQSGKEDGFFPAEAIKEAEAELENLQALKQDLEVMENDLETTKDPLMLVEIEKKLDKEFSPPKASPFLKAVSKAANTKDPLKNFKKAAPALAVNDVAPEADYSTDVDSDNDTDTDVSADVDSEQSEVAADFSNEAEADTSVSATADTQDYDAQSSNADEAAADFANASHGEDMDLSTDTDANAETVSAPQSTSDEDFTAPADTHTDGDSDAGDGDDEEEAEKIDPPTPLM